MIDQSDDSQLKFQLKRFLFIVLNEEKDDPAISVVRSELAKELTDAVKSGFRGETIIQAMTEGVRDAFKAEEIQQDLSAAIRPSINSAAVSILEKVFNNEQSPMVELFARIHRTSEAIGTDLKSVSAKLDAQKNHGVAAEVELRVTNLMKAHLGGIESAIHELSNRIVEVSAQDPLFESHSTQSSIQKPTNTDQVGSQGAFHPPAPPAAKNRERKSGLLQHWPAVAAGIFGLIGGISILLLLQISNKLDGLRNQQPRSSVVSSLPSEQQPSASRMEESRPLDAASGFQTPAVPESASIGLARFGIAQSAKILAADYPNARLTDCESDLAPCDPARLWPRNEALNNDDLISDKAHYAQGAIQGLMDLDFCTLPEDLSEDFAIDGNFGPDSIRLSEAFFSCAAVRGEIDVERCDANTSISETINCLVQPYPDTDWSFQSDKDANQFFLVWLLGYRHVF
ncbi:MAG: hypothetical protein AAF996_03210 [Pseudomonadota bacterium]